MSVPSPHDHRYPAKVLLIGEYAVLDGSPFLVTPYPTHGALWSNTIDPHPAWKPFVDYLTDQCSTFLNLDLLQDLIAHKWTIDLQIPTGYGIGSSGALCAALYDQLKSDTSTDLDVLKGRLAKMEDYFHGNSSGLDPLVSYLNTSLIGEADTITSTDFNLSQFPEISLVDSGMTRSTATYVEIYKKKKESKTFQHIIQQLIDLNRLCIQAITSDQSKDYKIHWQKISHLQFEHFKEMIPDYIHTQWQQGLVSKRYYMKLCGAGGGGYFLRLAE